jgi:hypothetical protein
MLYRKQKNAFANPPELPIPISVRINEIYADFPSLDAGSRNKIQ